VPNRPSVSLFDGERSGGFVLVDLSFIIFPIEEAYMFGPKKILVPTDFSEFSDDALAEAIDIALQYDSTIYLMHIVALVYQCSVDYCLSGAAVDSIREAVMTSAQEMTDRQIEKVGKGKRVKIVTLIREASPVYQEIVREQMNNDIDLVVIASHGKSGVVGHVLGNVADRVMENATCPVYVIKRPG
jgi:universal stress protein A